MSINLLEGEKTFFSAKQIKYLFIPSKADCDSLVVVFSAFNPKGAPPAYNYIRTLHQQDVNKLFILDDQGERGSYYLGENRIFDVESSVVSLITFIANENNIPHKNIICCGSSKGGYASLYFGIKYGFGHVIAGAPQTLLGNYLSGAEEYNTLEFIAGDTSRESVEFLNNLLYDVVNNAKKVPDICIHVGTGDHHYKGHVLPFKEYLSKYNFKCDLDIKEYNDHGDVQFYQKLLIEKLLEKVSGLKDAIRIENAEVKQNENNFIVQTKTNKFAEYAWYVYKDENLIERKWYSKEDKYIFTALENGTYYFKAFAKDKYGNIVTKNTEKYLVNKF